MNTFLRLLIWALGSVSLFGGSYALVALPVQTWSDTDRDIVFNQENKVEIIKTLNEQHKKVTTTNTLTCDNMYQLIKDSSQPRIMPYYNDTVMETSSAQNISVKWASVQSSRTPNSLSSKTNTQIDGVDETDVIKVVWSNVYFANTKDSKLMNYQITKQGKPILMQWIKIPSGLSNPQILQEGNNLMIIWNYYNEADKWTIYDSSSQTMVLQYSINNTQLTAVRAYRLQWSYVDSRLAWWKLTLIQNQYTKYIESWADTKKLSRNLWASIIYNPDNGETTKTSSVIWCDKVQSFVGSTWTSANVSIVRTLNLTNWIISAQSAYLWNFWTLYLDAQGIIWTVTIDRPTTRCGGLAKCFMPSRQNNGQMIVTLSQTSTSWDLVWATPVIGYVPGQYAIGRRPDWGHIIVTSDWNNGARTNVFTIWKSWLINDAIINIAPRESFQSARTIWNKLYLVTFEQKDPLFVIDIWNSDKLKILWELVIPWFSSYLHPYWAETNGKQLLLWLGQWPVTWNPIQTIIKWKKTWKNGPDEQWIKLDLYEIDFNKVINWNISTKQISSLRVWGEWTTTPALYDPRTFVWNNITKQVYLPISRMVYNYQSNSIINQQNFLFYGYKIFTATPSGVKLTTDVDLKSSLISLLDPTQKSIESLHYDTMRIWFINNLTFIINNHFIGTVLGWAKQFISQKDLAPRFNWFEINVPSNLKARQPFFIKAVAKDQNWKVFEEYQWDVYLNIVNWVNWVNSIETNTTASFKFSKAWVFVSDNPVNVSQKWTYTIIAINGSWDYSESKLKIIVK